MRRTATNPRPFDIDETCSCGAVFRLRYDLSSWTPSINAALMLEQWRTGHHCSKSAEEASNG